MDFIDLQRDIFTLNEFFKVFPLSTMHTHHSIVK